jgi:hypothetical protein
MKHPVYCRSSGSKNNILLEKNNFLNRPHKYLVILQRNGSIPNAVSNQLIPLGKTAFFAKKYEYILCP